MTCFLFYVILNEVKNPTEELTIHIPLTQVVGYFACAQYDVKGIGRISLALKCNVRGIGRVLLAPDKPVRAGDAFFVKKFKNLCKYRVIALKKVDGKYKIC